MLKLGWSLMAASALHVAVLAGVGAFSEGDGPGLAGLTSTGGDAARVIRPALAAKAGQLDRAGAQAAPHWQWRLVSTQPKQPPRIDEAAPAPARGSDLAASQASADAAHPMASAPGTDQVATTEAAGRSASDEYLPRQRLTRAPRAQQLIDIPFPPGVPTPGRYKAVLALYIDETGTVRRVKVADADLPGAYEEAARNAFQSASFVPGELKGRAVKSLIHIEVVFEESRGTSAANLAQAQP
jgi:hypothetical protein